MTGDKEDLRSRVRPPLTHPSFSVSYPDPGTPVDPDLWGVVSGPVFFRGLVVITQNDPERSKFSLRCLTLRGCKDSPDVFWVFDYPHGDLLQRSICLSLLEVFSFLDDAGELMVLANSSSSRRGPSETEPRRRKQRLVDAGYGCPNSGSRSSAGRGP